ncbi:MAG: hypothetical protein S4CHLAM102_12940 [Chlamydiia bacterium]|nr:hypothetical protein [Chlamydiia bacterium]
MNTQTAIPQSKPTTDSGSRAPKEKKLGTLLGVYLPGVISMFSVILFLRMGWIVGSGGLVKSILIITFACLITFITSLSIASVSTNMTIKEGGTYYMISRVFGTDIGASVGLPLFIAQSMTIGLSVLGFTQSLTILFPQVSVQSLSYSVLVLITLLAYMSSRVALKSQLVVICFLIASVASFVYGVTGYVPPEGIGPDLEPTMSGWALFAVFFPAATGIEMSASMSGRLKNPSRSLVLGTIGIILTGYLIYLTYAVLLWNYVPNQLLRTDLFIIEHVSKSKELIMLGLWLGTLTSALNYAIAAPRSLQALSLDGVVPGFFGKESGPSREPTIAVMTSFLISLVVVGVGQINVIATALSMILLITYVMLNLAMGLEGLLANFSWRPTFYLPYWIPFSGALFGLVAMLMIDPGWALISIGFVITIYSILRWKGVDSTVDDLKQSLLFFLSRILIYRLASNQTKARAWRPHLLVFSEVATKPTKLLRFASELTKDQGFLTTACIIHEESKLNTKRARWAHLIRKKLKEFSIQSLVEVHFSSNLTAGMRQVIDTYGMGTLVPNTVVLGQRTKAGTPTQFIDVILHSLKAQKNVIIFREGSLSETFIQEPQRRWFGGQSEQSQIDIWWDAKNRGNSEHMLIIANLLKRGSHWRKCQIVLKSCVVNEQGKKTMETFFDNFAKSNRYQAERLIYQYDKETEQALDVVKKHSSRRGLVLLGVRPPAPDESSESYLEYYNQLCEATEACASVAFVLCSGSNDIHSLFEQYTL